MRSITKGGDFTPPAGYEVVTTFKGRVFGFEEWFGFIIRSTAHAVVAFRGTQSDIDYIGDGDILQVPCPYAAGAGRVHDGFLSIYNSCRPSVLDALRGLPAALPVYSTGHSLGAALATLCAFDVAVQSGAAPIMYNFGSPRVGDPEFVAAYTASVPHSVRVLNVHDIVPKLPPSEIVPQVRPIEVLSPVTDVVWRYQHVPSAFRFDADKGGIIANHAIATYVEALHGMAI